jgi:hypothetical protein
MKKRRKSQKTKQTELLRTIVRRIERRNENVIRNYET